MQRRDTIKELKTGVLSGDRAVLGRALTLIESNRLDHRRRANELLTALLPFSGKAHRIGITGVPGVGKSTFIEAFGLRMTERGHRIAVLAVDPSSSVSKGSILGDKTRMEELTRSAAAFIRPSPSGGSLGGVARKTRESIIVCEAAGFDVVLVETELRVSIPGLGAAGAQPVDMEVDRRRAEVCVDQAHLGAAAVPETQPPLAGGSPVAPHIAAVRPALQTEAVAGQGRQLQVEGPVVGEVATGEIGLGRMSEPEAIVEAADRSGLMLAVNQNGRWDPAIRACRELIERGVFGQLVTASFELQLKSLGW